LHFTELPLSEQQLEAAQFPQGNAGPTGPSMTHSMGLEVKEHGTGYGVNALQNEATAGLSGSTMGAPVPASGCQHASGRRQAPHSSGWVSRRHRDRLCAQRRRTSKKFPGFGSKGEKFSEGCSGHH